MNNRMEKIIAMSNKNNISLLNVMEIYSKFNYKIYYRATKKDGNFRLYEPELEEQTMKCTERYFRRFGK
jgi:hypothetical protein